MIFIDLLRHQYRPRIVESFNAGQIVHERVWLRRSKSATGLEQLEILIDRASAEPVIDVLWRR